jgi:hypothetical protein
MNGLDHFETDSPFVSADTFDANRDKRLPVQARIADQCCNALRSSTLRMRKTAFFGSSDACPLAAMRARRIFEADAPASGPPGATSQPR